MSSNEAQGAVRLFRRGGNCPQITKIEEERSMQKGFPAWSFFAFAVACALILAACGGGSSTSSTVTSVSITPTSANVPLNETAEFTAVVNLANSSTATSTSTVVTWEVNGVAGGSSTTGTIVASSTDEQVGIYTAPSVVPSTNNGQVNITAVVPQNPSSTTTSSSANVTSNTAVVTIGAGTGLAITELTTSVPAGANHQYAATLNGLNDPNATWSVSSANGGDVGSINSLSGLYTAPDFPPPGGVVTITATDPTVATPATATAQIVYSNHSLSGPFAFSYSGNDSGGFLAAAGSFVADGQGNITSGIEDFDSFLTGVSVATPFKQDSTYVVGPDGRTTATIDTGHGIATLQFALTTNRHGLMIRFDANDTGSGTIDQQNLNDLTTSPTVVTGPYVFNASGTDAAFKPMALAGEFTSNGSNGIPASGTMIDVNDGGGVTTESPTLNGSYALDAANAGTGRGTLTLPGITAPQLQFAFYVIDSTHLHIVEIDGNAFLAGDIFEGATGGFSAASLAAGTYVFTAGGASSTGAGNAYAQGGAFISNGSGSITGGALDTNNAGTVTTNATINTCGYSVDATTGRIGLTLCTSSGTPEFAAYQTAQGTAVMVELDSAAISTGVAYSQVSADASTVPAAGSFAFVLGGQGMFHDIAGSAQPEVEGQLTLSGTGITGGNFDINNFNAVFKTDPVNTSNSTIAAPASNGRGTATLEGENPDVTYKLVYYLIDGNTAVLFDQDAARVAIGMIARQF